MTAHSRKNTTNQISIYITHWYMGNFSRLTYAAGAAGQ